MSERLRVIVTGFIAQYPLGGVSWDYVQYVTGLMRLGHDVYYLEDTGQWPYNPVEGGRTKDHSCAFNVAYLTEVMARFGLAERWAFHFPWQSRWYGLADSRRREILESADLLINVSGSLAQPDQYRQVRRLAYIDSDPVFTQVKLARGQADFQRMVDIHDVHFSFGECLSEKVPSTGHRWLPTRQPVVLSEWQPSGAPRDMFTTVMNWTSYKPVRYGDQTYGQKDVEFRRYLDLPGMVAPASLELAVNAGKTSNTPLDLLRRKGWNVADPSVVCPDLETYRQYISSSKGEWSVAKNGYVVGRSGWFSCRSACYLAAGRPVIVQETGFSDVLPTGAGILAFSTLEEAAAAIDEVETNYLSHTAAAESIAQEYFNSDTVLTHLVEAAMHPIQSSGSV
jgi:hypothetical protein